VKFTVIITDNGKKVIKEIEARNAIEAGVIAENLYENFKKKEGKENEKGN
jgi:hypothetical protein